MNKIFERIKSEMDKQKIKQNILSCMTGISVRTIQRMLKDEDGKSSNVFKICDALGIELKMYDKDTELATKRMLNSIYGINATHKDTDDRISEFEFHPEFTMHFKIPAKKYYIITKIFKTSKGDKIYQFLCIVNDEFIAKDFCDKNPGCEYKEEIVECKPEVANL